MRGDWPRRARPVVVSARLTAGPAVAAAPPAVAAGPPAVAAAPRTRWHRPAPMVSTPTTAATITSALRAALT